jgi:mono/diheme cytochrome c family protein
MKYMLTAGWIAAVWLAGCSPEKPKNLEEFSAKSNPLEEAVAKSKGIGPIKSVTLATPLEQDRIPRGKAIYEMKCQACHKLDDQRVVGPGWKGVTQRRTPEWIMNMIVNVEVMLEKDEEAQRQLELCLVRMPNQNVSIGDARDILEFMRQNDGEK